MVVHESQDVSGKSVASHAQPRGEHWSLIYNSKPYILQFMSTQLRSFEICRRIGGSSAAVDGTKTASRATATLKASFVPGAPNRCVLESATHRVSDP